MCVCVRTHTHTACGVLGCEPGCRCVGIVSVPLREGATLFFLYTCLCLQCAFVNATSNTVTADWRLWSAHIFRILQNGFGVRIFVAIRALPHQIVIGRSTTHWCRMQLFFLRIVTFLHHVVNKLKRSTKVGFFNFIWIGAGSGLHSFFCPGAVLSCCSDNSIAPCHQDRVALLYIVTVVFPARHEIFTRRPVDFRPKRGFCYAVIRGGVHTITVPRRMFMQSSALRSVLTWSKRQWWWVGWSNAWWHSWNNHILVQDLCERVGVCQRNLSSKLLIVCVLVKQRFQNWLYVRQETCALPPSIWAALSFSDIDTCWALVAINSIDKLSKRRIFGKYTPNITTRWGFADVVHIIIVPPKNGVTPKSPSEVAQCL